MASVLGLEQGVGGLLRSANVDGNAAGRRGGPAGLTIALSREVGALGNTVARELGRRLNWTVYDSELIDELARELQVRPERLAELEDREASWLRECMERFCAVPLVHEGTYCRHLVQRLFELAHRGRSIIVGRGAAQILPAATTLRVRLLASLEDRIAVVCRQHNLTAQQAAEYIAFTDRQRIRFVKERFNRDPTDPLSYDLVINTSRFSVAETAELIVQALGVLASRQPTHA